MLNTNRDYLCIIDVKNGTVVAKRPLKFITTDKNTMNIFVKLVVPIYVDDDLIEYADMENASNYQVIMHTKKPNKNILTTSAVYLTEGLFQLNLDENYINIGGVYSCEFAIHSTVNNIQEITTTEKFIYNVTKSIISDIDMEETEEVTNAIQALYMRMDEIEAQLSKTDLSKYAPIDSPNFVGSISLGRTENSEVGGYSTTFGYDGEASGYCSSAFGNTTTASGFTSHAEGYNTIASSDYQYVQGRYNIEDNANKYVHIVGNGTGTANLRSNAYTLDWNGNGYFQGNVSVDGTPTNDNHLVTKKYVANAIADLDVNIDLSDYATKTYVDESILNASLGGDIEINLSDYATKTYVDEAIADLDVNIDLSNYVTEQELTNKNYATKTYVDNAIEDVDVTDQLGDYATKDYVDSKKSYEVLESKVIFDITMDEMDEKYYNNVERTYTIPISNRISYDDMYYLFDRNYYSEMNSEYKYDKYIYRHTINWGSYNEYCILSYDNSEVYAGDAVCFVTINTQEMIIKPTFATTANLKIIREKIRFVENQYLENDIVIQSSLTIGSRGKDNLVPSNQSVTIGDNVDASQCSLAIGRNSKTLQPFSFAQGVGCIANSTMSFVQGMDCIANSTISFAQGISLIASSDCQHVFGRYNIEDTEGKYACIVGNGNFNRSNAYTLDWNGNAWYQGELYVGGTNQDDANKVLSTQDIYFDENGNLCVTINGVTKRFKAID